MYRRIDIGKGQEKREGKVLRKESTYAGTDDCTTETGDHYARAREQRRGSGIKGHEEMR